MIRLIIKKSDLRPSPSGTANKYVPYSDTLPRYADQVVVDDGEGSLTYLKNCEGTREDPVEELREDYVIVDFDRKSKSLTPRAALSDIDQYKLDCMRARLEKWSRP